MTDGKGGVRGTKRGGGDEATLVLAARGRPAAPVGLRITVVSGPDAGAAQQFGQRTVVVGRGQGADFRLTDRSVSEFHLEISPGEGGLRLRDLGSRNGTRVGSVTLTEGAVADGAVVEVGTSALRLEADATLKVERANRSSFGGLLGRSDVMRELFSVLARLARTDLSVLIEGQTGTGKEVAARALHAASRYAQGPFVVLDCTAVPATLAESVLFGHERGAFTGAAERRAGIFEAAHGGTVFLDEVGELPLDLQPKLLRVLERREVVRVGDTQPRAVNVRVISATWRDLRAMVNEGRFREDLYYRLAQARVVIPPLRERPEDIAQLAMHFLREIPAEAAAARDIAPDAMEQLQRREFRGNVRELKNTVERAALMAEGPVISVEDLAFERMLSGEQSARAAAPAATTPPPPAGGPDDSALPPFKEAKRTIVDEFEKKYLQRLLERSGGRLTRAAAVAGVKQNYLRELFRKHGLYKEPGDAG